MKKNNYQKLEDAVAVGTGAISGGLLAGIGYELIDYWNNSYTVGVDVIGQGAMVTGAAAIFLCSVAAYDKTKNKLNSYKKSKLEKNLD
jgi:hypothetical protein